MTYEEAKPFVEKLYDMAMWYHAKPNEFKRRVYDIVDDIAKAEREACAKVVDHILKEAGGTYGDAIRARGNT
jgi:hypothetical protein